MIMFFFFIIILIVALFLEGTITTLPLVLVGLLCLTIMKREPMIFVVAFLSGLILDLLTVHPVGLSSLYFIVFVFLIFLYQRKYEINSYQFVGVLAFIGSFVFLSIFGGGNLFFQSLISAIIAIILFAIMSLGTKRGDLKI